MKIFSPDVWARRTSADTSTARKHTYILITQPLMLAHTPTWKNSTHIRPLDLPYHDHQGQGLGLRGEGGGVGGVLGSPLACKYPLLAQPPVVNIHSDSNACYSYSG